MIGECFTIDLVFILFSTVKTQTFCDYLVDAYIDDDSDFITNLYLHFIYLFICIFYTGEPSYNYYRHTSIII